MKTNNFIDLDSYSIDTDSIFRDHVEPFKLWFDYLRLSPSYWLAHQYKTNALNAGTPLPNNFQAVLNTYEDFGSVYDLPFDWWWRTSGERLFGKPYRPRPPVILGRAEEMNEDIWLKRRQQLSELDEVYGYKLSDGRDYLLIAVPLDGQVRKALSQLSSYFAETGPTSDLLRPDKSTYLCLYDRFRPGVLENHLNFLLVRAEHPEWSAVEISKHVKISLTNPDKLEKIYTPGSLKTMVSRKTRIAWTIAENAARGLFPTDDEVTLPKIDYAAIWKRVCETKIKDQEFE